jgi:hypothetical protein
MFLTESLYVFPRPSSPVLQYCTYTVQVKCILLHKKHYVNPEKVTGDRHCISYTVKIKLESAFEALSIFFISYNFAVHKTSQCNFK